MTLCFINNTGDVLCVTSNINGGGKTHSILQAVYDRQRNGQPCVYRRVPFRESSSHHSLVSILTRVDDEKQYAFHIDIGVDYLIHISITNVFLTTC